MSRSDWSGPGRCSALSNTRPTLEADLLSPRERQLARGEVQDNMAIHSKEQVAGLLFATKVSFFEKVRRSGRALRGNSAPDSFAS
jgi:hypothetical protein